MQIFTRKFSELSGNRWDCHYYQEYYDKNLNLLKKLNSKNIGKLVIFSNETYDFKEENLNNTFEYIEISGIDLEDGSILATKILEKDAPSRAKMLVKENDIIVFSTRPNRGAIAIIPKELNRQIVSTGFIVIRELSQEILRKYLYIALKLNFSLLQMSQLSTGGNYPAIIQDDFKKLLIPIPPLKTQQEIIDIMDKAYKNKKEKEEKAKELLSSIDDYLLKELGIVLPVFKNDLKERVFIRKFSELSGARFDANYHQSYYKELERALENSSYPYINLSGLIQNFKKGIEIGTQNYKNEGAPFVKVSDIEQDRIKFENVEKFITYSLYENLKDFKPKANELLCSKDSTIGISLKADTSRDYIISSAILRLELKENVNLDFLQTILASHILNLLANREAIGAVIKHLNLTNFLSLKVPLPPLKTQEKIVSKINALKDGIKELKVQAKELLSLAKIDVEKLILGVDGTLNELEVDFEMLVGFLNKFKGFNERLLKAFGYAVAFIKDIGYMSNGSLISDYFYTNKAKRAYIRIKDLSFNESINMQSLVYISDDFEESAETKVKENDIIFATIGATIGKVNLVPNSLNDSFISNNTSRFRLFNSAKSNAKFYEAIFQSSFFQSFIKRNTTTTAQPKIINEDILNIKIPLSPLKTQEKIADQISTIKEKALALQKAAKQSLEEARQEVEKMILKGV